MQSLLSVHSTGSHLSCATRSRQTFSASTGSSASSRRHTFFRPTAIHSSSKSRRTTKPSCRRIRRRTQGSRFYSPPWRLPDPDALGDHSDEVVTAELEESGLFRNLASRRYLWDVIYNADDYIAVLSTYSHHRALHDKALEPLLARIHRRIESRPERNVRKTYLAMLYVTERA